MSNNKNLQNPVAFSDEMIRTSNDELRLYWDKIKMEESLCPKCESKFKESWSGQNCSNPKCNYTFCY